MKKTILLSLIGALAVSSAFANDRIFCSEKYVDRAKYGNTVRVRTLEIDRVSDDLLIVTAEDAGENYSHRSELRRLSSGVYEGFAENAFEGSVLTIQLPRNMDGIFGVRMAYYNNVVEGDPTNGAWQIHKGCKRY